ncbi:MAG: hypothetical protein GY795_17165 [Desulfobacterales bacterium]|nr:hypothetical protein [Desulfobacterales bacterium]
MSKNSRSVSYIFFAIGPSFLILIVYVLLQWLGVPTGRLTDWIIGIASFWWLMIIVTLPWNMYFKAKEILEAAVKSAERKIKVDPKEIEYSKNIARRSLTLAIILHLLSAMGLHALAIFEISPVGYISSVAALLLTGLRPALRAHEYVLYRLSVIRGQLFHPREDIAELRDRFKKLEENVKQLNNQMDTKKPDSWVSAQERHMEAINKEVTQARVLIEDLRVNNKSEHERLSREAKQAIAQITEDGQFLEHVRELIRFVKAA